MTQMTDENDNLVDVPEIIGQSVSDRTSDLAIHEDEWTPTPKGHCKLDLELDADVIKDLIDQWARTNLHEASLEQYEEVLASDGQEAAVYSAVLNDLIIDALTAVINQAETEAENDAEDV